jgi:hypothetical protein
MFTFGASDTYKEKGAGATQSWPRLDARYQLPNLILRVKFIDGFGEKLRASGPDSRMLFELTR